MFEDNRSHRLRRLIAELAECDRDDISAILDALKPTARRRVESLLEEYHRMDDESALELNTEAAGLGSLRLSPWLSARLLAGEISQSAKMTEHTRAALRSCASDLFPQAGVSERTNASASPSLVTRARSAWSLFLRGTR